MKFQLKTFAGRPAAEKSDCVVRAFSVAAGVNYLDARAILEECGRRRGMRTKHSVTHEAAKSLNLEKLLVLNGMTVRRALELLTPVPECAIWVNGHMIPVARGMETDIKPFAKPRQIVKAVFITAGHDFGKL